jgi:hypothetical protein
MKKFKTKFVWLKGKDMPFTGYRLTGVWGLYSSQSRHHWFGIKGLFGFRFSKEWGMDY